MFLLPIVSKTKSGRLCLPYELGLLQGADFYPGGDKTLCVKVEGLDYSNKKGGCKI